MTDEEFYISPEDERKSNPFTDGELMTEVKDYFRAYIFAKPSREVKRGHVGWCSACGEFIDEDAMKNACAGASGGYRAQGAREFQSAEKKIGLSGKLRNPQSGFRHNADIDCPHCGRSATIKEDGRMRNYKTIFEDHSIAYIYVAAEDLVYIRVFDTAARYGSDEPEADFYPYYGSELFRYRLRPGEWVCEKNHYIYGGAPRFLQSKNPLDLPCNNKNGFALCGSSRLENSFLRYHRLADYFDNCEERTAYAGYYYRKDYYPLKYLCRFAICPQIEMAQRLGLHWAVNDLVNDNRQNARLINWKAQTVDKFLRLDKQTAKAYIKESREKEVLELLRRYNGFYTVAECKLLLRSGGRASELGDALQKYGLTHAKLQNYIEKSGITASDWLDYVSGAETLGYDLTVHNVLLPKNFHEAHDAAILGLAVADFKKLNKKKQAALKRRAQKYEWKIGGWVFRFPLAARQIVEEGKALGHCVGGYAGRHMDGKTNIVFLRRADAPDKSVYTIEIDGETVRQAYGEKNRIKPQDDSAVAACYKLWQLHLTHDLRLKLCGNFEKLKYKEKRPCRKTA